eukprot:GSA120T00004597001.1
MHFSTDLQFEFITTSKRSFFSILNLIKVVVRTRSSVVQLKHCLLHLHRKRNGNLYFFTRPAEGSDSSLSKNRNRNSYYLHEEEVVFVFIVSPFNDDLSSCDTAGKIIPRKFFLFDTMVIYRFLDVGAPDIYKYMLLDLFWLFCNAARHLAAPDVSYGRIFLLGGAAGRDRDFGKATVRARTTRSTTKTL